MPSKYGNTAFYNSAKWRKVSAAYMASKNYICERCGKPAQICHHRKYLTDVNVTDPDIALGFDNLEALCMECHNAEHGSRRATIQFDEAGNVSQIYETKEAREYRRRRSQIDDVVEKAKALFSVVS